MQQGRSDRHPDGSKQNKKASCSTYKTKQFCKYLWPSFKFKLNKKAVINCYSCHKQQIHTCLDKSITCPENAVDRTSSSSCHQTSVTGKHSHAVQRGAIGCAVCQIIVGGLACTPIHTLLHLRVLGAVLGSGFIGSGLEGIYYTQTADGEISFTEFLRHTGIGFFSSVLASLVPIASRFSKWVQLLPIGKRLLAQALSGSVGAVIGRTIHLLSNYSCHKCVHLQEAHPKGLKKNYSLIAKDYFKSGIIGGLGTVSCQLFDSMNLKIANIPHINCHHMMVLMISLESGVNEVLADKIVDQVNHTPFYPPANECTSLKKDPS